MDPAAIRFGFFKGTPAWHHPLGSAFVTMVESLSLNRRHIGFLTTIPLSQSKNTSQTWKLMTIEGYFRIILAYAFLFLEPVLRVLFSILPLRLVAETVRESLAMTFGSGHVHGDALKLSSEVEVEFLELHSTEDFISHWYPGYNV